MEVVEDFLDTHIDMFITYTVEAVEDFLDIHIHHPYGTQNGGLIAIGKEN